MSFSMLKHEGEGITQEQQLNASYLYAASLHSKTLPF